jgi:FkbM family methyltransferase
MVTGIQVRGTFPFYIFSDSKPTEILVSNNKIAQQFSITLGNILFRNFFPVYNIIYPIFKRKQDAEEIALLKTYIKKGETVLDIGANIGFYSKILSELVGEAGKVYSFEPDQLNFNCFLKNTKGVKNIVPVNKAVADQTKTLKLYTSKELNVDHRTYKVDEYEKEINIDAVSIDDFVGNKFKVDFIKMDIQGFELFALKGMQQTLINNPSVKLITELWPYGLEKAGTTFDDFFAFFKKNGLKIYKHDGHSLMPFDERELIAGREYPKEFYFNILITH